MKWSELKAQGVQRCCAMLRNRRTRKVRQCVRRAVSGTYWCAVHGPRIEAEVAKANEAIREAARSGASVMADDDDDD